MMFSKHALSTAGCCSAQARRVVGESLLCGAVFRNGGQAVSVDACKGQRDLREPGSAKEPSNITTYALMKRRVPAATDAITHTDEHQAS